jgi:hypothetical protein
VPPGSLAAAFGALLCAIAPAAAALDFQCVEPSRYKNLLPVFSDDPNLFFSYFGLERRRLPDLESCRAMLVTGALGAGDADAVLDRVIQGKGWLAVLYLAFAGADLEEEAKVAATVRAFSLKTRAVRHATYLYQPDFAIRWEALVPLSGTSAAPPPARDDISPLFRGLKVFRERRDLLLRLDPNRSACNEGCRTVWTAGVNRLYNSLPANAPAPPPPVTDDADTMRRRAAVAYHIDWNRLPAANDPILSKPLDWIAVTPPAMARLLRDKCSPEFAVAESLEGRLAGAFGEAARNNLRPGAVEGLAAHFEALSRAGARLQQCLAAAQERERLARFHRHCTPSCDKPALSAALAAAARDILDRASKM